MFSEVCGCGASRAYSLARRGLTEQVASGLLIRVERVSGRGAGATGRRGHGLTSWTGLVLLHAARAWLPVRGVLRWGLQARVVLARLSGLSCLLGSFPLNGVVSNVLSKSAVIMVRGGNLWISSQDLHGGIKGLLEVVEEDTALSDLLGLSERVSNHGVLVDPHVQVSLQSVLRLSHEEESDLFGDRVTDVSQNEAEVSINTETKIPHDWVTAHLGWWVLGRWLSAWWHASWWSVGVLLSLQVVTLVLLELMVVSEVIVEFRVDNCFDERSGMVS